MGNSLDPTHPLVPELQQLAAEVQALPGIASPYQWGENVSSVVQKFVAVHQRMPQTTFADPVQHGMATSGGERPLVPGAVNGAEALASHFDGAAAYGMSSPEQLAHAYQDWAGLAGPLGGVNAEAVHRVAAQTFNDKNFGEVWTLGAQVSLEPGRANFYLEGALRWDQGMTQGFPAGTYPGFSDAAVQDVWSGVRGQYTPEHFGLDKATPELQAELRQRFDQVQAAARPQDAELALRQLAYFYQQSGNLGRRNMMTVAPDGTWVVV
jgi:hypothetical protein